MAPEAGGAALACMPPAGFGARLHVSENDDLHDSGEMEVSDMYAGANGLGACAQVQSLDVNPNRFHRATIVGEFEFDEMEEEEEE